MSHLKKDDHRIEALIDKERISIEKTIDIIAAENHAPPSVMEVLGSVLNTKTIEGYPGKRFHAGCKHVDDIENVAVQGARELFGDVRVQAR